MNRSRRILMLALVGMAAATVAIVVLKIRKVEAVAVETADDIEAQLDALDPVTRAATVAKLSTDAVKDVKARRA